MGDYEGRRNRRKRATRQAQAIRIKACVDLVNFHRFASSMGDGSPIRYRRKGQRLVVDSDGDQIEQSLEVLCQKLNDDRRGTLCSRLQTSYKLVQESESKRDIAPPEDRSSLQLVADAHFRGTLPDVRPTLRLGEEIAAKVSFDRTALDPRTLPDPFGLLTATNAKESSPFGRLLSER